MQRLPAIRSSVFVPKNTQVATAGGEGEPVVFETADAIELTAAEIDRVVFLDPRSDLYADCSSLIARADAKSAAAPTVTLEPVAHEFFIGHDVVLDTEPLSRLSVRFEIASAGPAPADDALEWSIVAPNQPIVITPDADSTKQLTQSGDIEFKNLPPWPSSQALGCGGRWLRCRLKQPLASDAGSGAMVRRPLPQITGVRLSVQSKSGQLALKHALFNNLPLDTSKDYFPLGERPRFGDVFYIECEPFTQAGTGIKIDVVLTNPASSQTETPLRPTHRAGKPHLLWEYWNGDRWGPLDCRDDTEALTENGSVVYLVPENSKPVTVQGQDGSWIRARLVSGNYGEELGAARTGLADLAPPSVKTIVVSAARVIGPTFAESVLVHNNFLKTRVGQTPMPAFFPFESAATFRSALYLGLRAHDDSELVNRKLNLFVGLAEPEGNLFVRDAADHGESTLQVSYWNGADWQATGLVDDHTDCLRRSGIIEITLGDTLSPWSSTSLTNDGHCYWIRLIWDGGNAPQVVPRLRHLALNTARAAHAVRLKDEILGSSTEAANQVFYSARMPILDRVDLEVREPQEPSSAELASIQRGQGADAVRVVRNGFGNADEVWVRWHEVRDFLTSGVNDRHYCVNRITGEIRFGDGKKGRIPPGGANNVWLRHYRTGGGCAGNVPTESLTQLRTTLPSVDSVRNLVPAVGGQDVESWTRVHDRGSRRLRHRERAVTSQDYEDLALEALPNVARAHCHALRNLADDPLGKKEMPGTVSLVVVPDSRAPKPRPDLDMLGRVKQFLDQRRAPGPELIVAGPTYVALSVDVEVVPDEESTLSSDVNTTLDSFLQTFLHPVTGGFDGRGWPAETVPDHHDLTGAIEKLPGIAGVNSLRISLDEEVQDCLLGNNFLICSGKHLIRVAMAR